ncbi:hypothetical protein HMPREF7545_0841 [Selenomonas noxia ATCC 43541]|nr:hypothetical protein HMPREF7545_0841 [Selenomonas noxia ATCC 43541]
MLLEDIALFALQRRKISPNKLKLYAYFSDIFCKTADLRLFVQS